MWRVTCFYSALLIGMASCLQAPKLKLNNGNEIPALALGTFLGFDVIKNGPVKSQNKELRSVIEQAIDIGYRHIDTAAIYGTEEEIGEAINAKINDGTVIREDIFVTTKLWNTHHKREQVAQELKESLKNLSLNYVDLYLMHWPVALDSNNKLIDVDYLETWRGLEDVYNLGLAKSIGLSNFNKDQIQRILNEGNVKPSVLQIEVHPQIVQKDLVAFAQGAGLVVMGFSPFGALVSRFGMVLPGPKTTDKDLVDIAERYNKTVPQIVLAWMANRKIIPLPKTTKPQRLIENLNIFDVNLTEDDIAKIESYDSNTRFTLPSFWQESKNYPFDKVANPIPDPFAK